MSRETYSLILTSIRDLATDMVCHDLGKRGVPFLRLNIEQLPEVALTLNPVDAHLSCKFGGEEWIVRSSTLRTVWWRQATFSRNTPGSPLTPAEQLAQSQWPALMRGLMLFDEATWYNSPSATYRAESKPLQLHMAAKLGFDVPTTRMTNDPDADIADAIGTVIAAKSVDTVYLVQPTEQYFAYTRIVRWDQCNDEHFHLAPMTVQQVLSPKLDLRVTIVDDRVWCHAISDTNGGIAGDWRLRQKVELRYELYDLPEIVRTRCRELIRALGLRFGAIDLALVGTTYWFIEVNPTGEWAWLDGDLAISTAIGDCLAA